ncbi:hypothetical protein N658DRAFT_477446 [Parathielavia hyrcaniae]|uniref:Uncharacterized protein n=1 Tax=Parathielavia hyrcaniae TaxID=113614 RepID=A0AAN6SY75_9PEZI|nr:hypothetical protein N658DRAFT_477446 [Parathielavia hyrcaniae]
MLVPARILRLSLHGKAARPWLRSKAACAAASPPWPSPTELESRRQPSLHLSTTTRPPQSPQQTWPPRKKLTTLRQDTRVAPNPLPEIALFTSQPPLLSPDPSHHKPPDERKLELGKTLRILQSHLPTLLQAPLPQQILSPSITLHLFPSTHPHLPTVRGRVAYVAALWSSPIAWNRVPLVGNVRLEILSERVVDQPVYYHHHAPPGGGGSGGMRSRPEGACGEQLIVRWRTMGVGGGGGKGEEMGTTEVKAPVGMAQPAVGGGNKEFTGLFIFDFDSEGRILSHTIEHVQEGGQWEKGVGAKVVGLTDWLLGGIRGGDAPCPAFARKGRS